MEEKEIPELRMLEKELNKSYTDEFDGLRKHVFNLRMIALGLSNELKDKCSQLQAYKDREDKVRDIIQQWKYGLNEDGANELLQILNKEER